MQVLDSQNPQPAKPSYARATRIAATGELLLLCLILAIFFTLLVFVFYVFIKFSVPASLISGSAAGAAIVFLGGGITKIIPTNFKAKLRRFLFKEKDSFYKFFKERAYQPVVVFVFGLLFSSILCFALLFTSFLPQFFDPYTQRGLLSLNDDLQHYNSNHYHWDNDATISVAGCQLTSQGYQLIDNKPNTFQPCIAELPQYQNFVFEAHMTIAKGGDCGGFLLRDHPNVSSTYLLRICSNGFYGIARYNTGSGFGQFNAPCIASKGQVVQPGCNVMEGRYNQSSQSYMLAVVVNGSTFTVYVNGEPLQSQDDTTNTTEGHIGFVADAFYKHPTTVTFTDAQLWTFLS